MTCAVNAIAVARRKKKVWAYGTGTLFVILGGLTISMWQTVLESQVLRLLILREESPLLDMWTDIPIPIFLELYLFNWTNPDKVRDPKVKPHFQEIGPYVWVEKRSKEDIEFHENGTVSYWMVRTWHFSEERTKANLDESITCINMLPLSMAHTMRHKNSIFKKSILNPMINKYANISVTHKAREWIFEGYKDKLLDLGNIAGFGPEGYDKFGWLYKRNASKTYEGRFNIDTGKNDINRLGDIHQWNHANRTNFFEGECGIINGSTGDVWAPHRDVTKSISLFSADLCRPLNLSPGPDTRVKGISAKKFWLTDWSLGNLDKFPNMECFCPKTSDECLASGVVDVSNCRDGTPAWVSAPHFYMADECFKQAIDGMKPNEKTHRFVFTMEPTYSIPLEVHGAFQVNLRVKHYDHISIYKNVNKFLAPMLWIRQYGGIDDTLEKQVKLLLLLPYIGLCVGITLVCIGAILIGVGILLTFRKTVDGKEPSKKKFRHI